MDLTTLSVLLAMIAGLVGLDTVLHPASVVLDASIPPKYDRAAVDVDTISAILKTTVADISSTSSLVAAPKIRVGGNVGIGMAVAQAVHIEPIALALQGQVGYVPAQIKLALIGEDGTTKILVSGSNLGGRIHVPPFEDLVTLKQGESVVQLVHRAAIIGLGRIDPYFTALYLIGAHAQDHDFSAATALVDRAMTLIPPTPISPERAVFENLRGIIALFMGDAEAARSQFLKAADDYPSTSVVWLNAAFTDIQLDRYRDAVDVAQRVTRMQPAPNNVLMGTAYMTWGAALLGLRDVEGADQMLAKSVEANPTTSAGYDLWADVKHEKGDISAEQRFRRRALENSPLFENYAEVAALWFRFAWQNGAPISRNQFTNPVKGAN